MTVEPAIKMLCVERGVKGNLSKLKQEDRANKAATSHCCVYDLDEPNQLYVAVSIVGDECDRDEAVIKSELVVRRLVPSK